MEMTKEETKVEWEKNYKADWTFEVFSFRLLEFYTVVG